MSTNEKQPVYLLDNDDYSEEEDLIPNLVIKEYKDYSYVLDTLYKKLSDEIKLNKPDIEDTDYKTMYYYINSIVPYEAHAVTLVFEYDENNNCMYSGDCDDFSPCKNKFYVFVYNNKRSRYNYSIILLDTFTKDNKEQSDKLLKYIISFLHISKDEKKDNFIFSNVNRDYEIDNRYILITPDSEYNKQRLSYYGNDGETTLIFNVNYKDYNPITHYIIEQINVYSISYLLMYIMKWSTINDIKEIMKPNYGEHDKDEEDL